jgi:RimJ/RimL family protein N-acetyltransferase
MRGRSSAHPRPGGRPREGVAGEAGRGYSRGMVLDGPRIRLRPWREADSPAFAALNADPAVMRHFAAPLTRAESDAFLARIRAHAARHGFCFWAVEARQGGEPIGLCGLQQVPFEARFTPAVEIGWRLRPGFWGQGLAEEAARLALAAGFGPLELTEIVSFTVPANERSWRLMRRLGLRADGEFAHPRLPEEHPLRPHLLYRQTRAEWVRQRLG